MMKRFEIHGCKQGWRSRKGNRQKKALAMSTNEPRLEEYLSERCDHRPEEHEMIQGNETKRSERYPRKFVRRFIQALGNCKVESEEDVTGEDTGSEEEEEGGVKMRKMEIEEEEKVEETQTEEKLEKEKEKEPEKKDDATGESSKIKEEDSTKKEAQQQEEAKKEEEGKATNAVQKLGAGIAAIGEKIEEVGAECKKRNTAAQEAEEMKAKRETNSKTVE